MFYLIPIFLEGAVSEGSHKRFISIEIWNTVWTATNYVGNSNS